ncbi:MAG: type II secretion system GspH family protein [Phycisphaerales bacterium]|nr:type II secretion system protein [Planctomycetota bacterium]MCH8508269.1 type II secretion system GspH family protein [Phycisphaerales bacterium]
MNTRRAFSLLEITIVVVMLGILAAIAIPRFAGASDEARTASTESTLGSVRASIASFRAAAVIAGDDPFPTLTQLTDGSTLRFDLPANPFNNLSTLQSVNAAQAQNRAVVNPGGAGWNYFVDNNANPPVAIFYANSTATTTKRDSSGSYLTANQL